jgi:hypothetical protein
MERERLRMAGVITLMVAFVVVGWWLVRAGAFSRGTAGGDPMALKVPVATVRLDDGSRIEIFGLVEDEWVDGVMSKPRWHMGSTGKSTSVDGDHESLQTERFTLEKNIAGVRYLPGDGRLVMSLRYVTRGGAAESPATMKPGGLVIRLSDGGGLWVDGSGPFGADDDPQRRGIVSFNGWPRSGKELVFQAVLKGQAPVEFRLPNPAPGSSPASWTAAPLPQVRTGPHWEVRLVKARELTVPGEGKGVVGEFEFSCDLPEVGSFPPVTGAEDGVLGAFGTRSMQLFHMPRAPRSSLAYPMAPDENLFKFLYRIRHDMHFPYPKRGIPILAVGETSPDGKSIVVASPHPTRGIKTVEVGPVGAATNTWHPGPHQFAISFKGAWRDSAEKSAAEAAIGPWNRWTPVVFLDGEEHSSGSIQFRSSGTRGDLEFEWAGNWSGALKPGMKVEIGLMAKWPDEVLEFVVDRASLSPE